MVKKVDTKAFQTEAMNAPAAVVDFNATWCGPCRMLAPVLEDVSEKYEGRVSFFSVDVDESPERRTANLPISRSVSDLNRS